MSPKGAFNWKEFYLLTGAGIVGVIAVLPYALALQAPKLKEIHLPLPLGMLIPIQVIQNAIFIAIAVALGLILAQRIGLGAPLIEAWLSGQGITKRLKTILVPSVIAGSLLAILFIVGSDLIPNFVPASIKKLSQTVEVPAWQSLLASLYGGITEELLLRLFLFSLLAWVLMKICRAPVGPPGLAIMWTANLLSAILFGAGHLPAAASLTPLTAQIVVYIITGNALGGIVFGHLYWTRGLESAMLAHFTADVVGHVLAPLFS